MTAASRPTISAKPAAELAPRAGDEILHSDELQQFELFASLKKPISVEKFPGSIVLRRFRKGDVICRQGDRGHSAFYIVRGEDMQKLRDFRASREAGAATEPAKTSGDQTKTKTSARQVATAYILSGQAKASSGFLSGLFSRRSQGDSARPQFIPNDGPTDIDYATRQAPMCEGDVFGEMSCMTLAPRSASIVVDEECYMVEFLRNIFDQMQRDPGYRRKTDELYAERVLSTHLRRLELFQDLTDSQIEILRQASHLDVVDPGSVICDEGDRSDSVYLIRSGVVQVVRNAHVAFRTSDVADWPKFCHDLLAADPSTSVTTKEPAPADSTPLVREQAPPTSGDSRHCVWPWLMPRVQLSIRKIGQEGSASENDRQLVMQAVNELIRRREFIASADLLPVLERPAAGAMIDTFPQGIRGVKKLWSELEVRIAGGLAFRELFGEALHKVTARNGPPEILAYLSRGDCFGEMAVVLDVPRQATCIAYDHPADDSNRRPGRVELVRIDGAAFQKLLDDSPSLRATIDGLVSKRYADIVESDLRLAGNADTSLTQSEEFRDEGLIQGQNLLLIDLDRCTRCGDCVRACVNTHDDGHSRLFLDGPRFDRFLVPSACRQCLNPSCMIGCPVGSIQRGANGQIEIRDWCIGCTLCARQCPYDSIQMHDLGIIPEQSVGWLFAPVSQVGGAAWQKRRYRPTGWSVGVAPFNWTIDLFESLASSASAKSWQAAVGRVPEPICFRHEFRLSREKLRRGPFLLAMASKGLTVRAWVNGAAITAPTAKSPRKAKDDELQAQLESSQLRRGSNLLAVEVSPPAANQAAGFAPKYNQPILKARLDLLPQAGGLALATAGEGVDLQVELVKQKAVVCDLCSSLASQRPACVDQCPHEAALRVDARSEFPVC